MQLVNKVVMSRVGKDYHCCSSWPFAVARLCLFQLHLIGDETPDLRRASGSELSSTRVDVEPCRRLLRVPAADERISLAEGSELQVLIPT